MKLTPEKAQIFRHALNRLNQNSVRHNYREYPISEFIEYKIKYSLRRKVELNCQIEILEGKMPPQFSKKVVRDNYLENIVQNKFSKDCKILGTDSIKLVNIFIKNGKLLATKRDIYK